jgi:hypothetical protein
MNYSIIIAHAGGDANLKTLVPKLRAVFQDDETEVIIVEHRETGWRPRGALLNAGARQAKGDILVFHDANYYPLTEGTNGEPRSPGDGGYYDPGAADVLSPIGRVVHLTRDLDDDEFLFGTIVVFRREAFFRINGFNSIYRCRVFEDADLHKRIRNSQLAWKQGNAVFYALDHDETAAGSDDADRQRDNEIFMQWGTYHLAGVLTAVPAVREVTPPLEGIDHWLQVDDIRGMLGDGSHCASVEALARFYEDAPETHANIWLTCERLASDHAMLREHRNWVFANAFGYGARPLHWMWKIIVRDLPQRFKFLEIGVYMGQIVSLVSLLTKACNKEGVIIGITPLTNAGDKYSQHPNVNYREAINRIYDQFGIARDYLQIIEGFSNDERVIAEAQAVGPFDVIYVDGCHDYEVVKSDIDRYSSMVKIDGLLVIDDASNNLRMLGTYRGLEDVSKAVSDTVERDVRFRHLFAVGHNRVWRRVS